MKLHSHIKGFVAILGLATVLPAFSAERIEGLDLLKTVGRYERPLTRYFAVEADGETIDQRQKLGYLLGDKAGVFFDTESVLGLEGVRMALQSKTDPSATFEIDRGTGNFLFNSGLQKYRDKGDTKALPDESQAVELAAKYLQQLELTVNSKELVIEHIGGLNMGMTDGSGEQQVFEKLKTVRFSRMLDGLKVEGDGRIIVHLGEQGSLAGLVFQWPQLGKTETLSRKELTDPGVIQSRALEQMDRVIADAESARLVEASLVLYDDGQGVIEPAYHFVLQRHYHHGGKELTMIPYDFYVPTSTKPQAFYPFMEVAEVAPSDGDYAGKVENDVDE